MPSPAEAFLAAYHDRKPHVMSQLMDACRVAGDGRTSYEVLAARMPAVGPVLDLGCGDGALLAALARQGAGSLAGVDLSQGHLEVARSRPELAGADLRLGRAQELPFADGEFDAVVSHMVLMLIPDVEVVVAEAVRVLAPGGRFVAAIGGRVTGALKVFLELALPLFEELPARVQVSGNKLTRSRERLDTLLGPAGFEPVSWDVITLDVSGTAPEVWARCCEWFYSVDALDDGQLAGLKAAFDKEAAQLPAGMEMAIAETRLRR